MGAKATEKDSALPPRPPFWFRLPVAAGNLAQLAGLILGTGILYAAAHLQAPDIVRVLLMLVGWFAIYVCCHAIAHWAVGRLVGIEFQGYGLRGTDHPENYPPGLRQAMSAMPTFTVMTKKASMQQARPLAKALMFSAGESSTAVCSILAGYYAWRSGTPGGQILFWVMVGFNLFSTVVTALVPRGDYAKAWRALHAAKE
jgi:hypothetical protein